MLPECKRVIELAGSIWKEYGALEFIECVGDDLNQKEFVLFNQTANPDDSKKAFFLWTIFESTKYCDQVNATTMINPALAEMKLLEIVYTREP